MIASLLIILSTATASADTSEAPAGSPEIVVTASRREQPLSKVPSSVSALTQADAEIRNIKTLADAARFLPGVRVDPQTASVSIRGIMAGGGGAGTTGIYIDDTPIQMRALGFDPDDALPAIFDLERIEVLRGPQGTLFGAGSEGGTVRYITPQPSLTDLSISARAEVNGVAHGGQGWELGAAIGMPVVPDVLGVRVSAWHRRDAGYIDHVDQRTGRVDAHDIDSGQVSVLRTALAWRPAPGLLVTPALLYQTRSTNAWNIFFAGLSDRAAGRFRTSSPEARNGYDRYVLPSLNVRFETGNTVIVGNLSYFSRRNLTGYDGTIYDLSYYQHADVFPGPYEGNPNYPFLLTTGINPDLPPYYSPSRVLNGQSNLAGELRAQSSGTARLEWVAGIFWQRSDTRTSEALIEENADGFFQQVFGRSEEELFGYPNYGAFNYLKRTGAREYQTALFGNVRYAVTPRLKLSAGARVARTSFSFNGFEASNYTDQPVLSAGITRETPFTPRVGVEYTAGRSLFYASWAKGFRAGGANPPVNALACGADLAALGLSRAPEAYDADTIETIEAGAKGNVLNGNVQLSASAYQNRWHGIQQNVQLAGCGFQFIANLGAARVRGFDAQATLRPFRALSIDLALGYTKGRFTQTLALGPGESAVQRGDALEGPPWSLAAGARYDGTIGTLPVYLRGDVQYLSRLQRATPSRNPRNASAYLPGEQAPDAYTNVGARVGIRADNIDLSLFVDNLLDAAPRYLSAPVDAEALLVQSIVARPRIVGLSITVRQ